MAPANTPAVDMTSAQRIEDALKTLSPRWTVWVAQTLADGPLRLYEVTQQLPFTTMQNTSLRLKQMQGDGLIARTEDQRTAPYRLTGHGTALAPVFGALTEWSRQHLRLGPTAGAERVEDAFGRLHLRHSTAVVQLLSAQGPMRFVDFTQHTGMDIGSVGQRLARMQDDGLLTRTGPHFGARYTLTPAGQALAPVYAAVERWSTPFAPERPTAAPVQTAQRTHAAIPLGADPRRTAAALRRSPAATNLGPNVPAVVFSHAPQPPAPWRVTPAQPTRTR